MSLECVYCGKQPEDDETEEFYDFACKECAEIIEKGLKARHDKIVGIRR